MNETERVLRTAVTAMTTGDMETLASCFADDVVAHVPGNSRISGDYKGRTEVFERFIGTMMELTDGQLVLEPHDITGTEDHAVGIYTWRAVRDGKNFEWRQVNIYHVHNGRITELWQHPFDIEGWHNFWS